MARMLMVQVNRLYLSAFLSVPCLTPYPFHSLRERSVRHEVRVKNRESDDP